VTPPKVSVHVIAYNQRDFIREAIDSALGQDYPNLEVVVADDASTDGTADIVAEYQRRDPDRVVAVLGKDNLGITGNSNRALKACTGELIAFMGGDDVLLPGKIAAQVDWFARDPERVLCGHQVEVFYEDGSLAPHPLTRHLLSGRGAEPLIRHGPFGATSVMVRRDRIPVHGFDETLPVVSDQLLWIEVVRDDGILGHVPGTLARYRRHSANVTRDPLANLKDVERSLALTAERFPQFREAVDYAVTRRLSYDPAVAMLKQGRKAEARAELIKVLRREPLFVKAWVRMAQTYL
jgi:glycosyltransferase involved in cell wall biosynthesis